MATRHPRPSPWWAVAACWMARVLGTFGVVMLLVLVFGKNSVLWHIPAPFSHPINLMGPVLLKGGTPFANPSSKVLVICATAAMVLMLAGLIAGWWRDGLAALLILSGWALFQLAEQYVPPDIAFRLAVKWGNVQTNLDGSTSIRYKYRTELWNGGEVTNDQVFTFDQNRFVSVKEVSQDTTSTNEQAGG